MINTCCSFSTWRTFLALRDYASRAHRIAFCPSSVVRPSVSQLSLNLMHGILGSWFPLAMRPDVFLFFLILFYFFFYEYIFLFVNMGPYGSEISKRYSYKSQTNVFKLVLKFLSNGPHKTTFEILEILSFQYVFLRICFSKTANSPLLRLWRYQKPQLSGKRATVEQNGVKFGTRG